MVDEGDMVTQADGTTLETGSMVNPATGRVTAYEEVWEDEEPAAPCVVLEVDEGDGDDDGGGGKGKQGRVVSGVCARGGEDCAGEVAVERGDEQVAEDGEDGGFGCCV